MQQKLFYSVEESAQIIGISKSVIYKLVKGGNFPNIKMGKRIMIPVAVIQKLSEYSFDSEESYNCLIKGGQYGSKES